MKLKRLFSVLMLAALAAAGCGGDDAVSLSGTAAVGDPVAGGTVSFQCAGGIPLNPVTTASNGSWTVLVNGTTFPCVVSVSGGTPAASMTTIALEPGSNANVTPLTELIFAAAAGTTPAAWAAAHKTDFATALAALALKLPAASAAVKASLTASGYTVPSGNLLTGDFKPVAGDAYDDLLEALKNGLADSGKTFAELVTATAGAGTGTFVIPYTRFITAAEVATTPKLNSSSLSISGDVLTMKTNPTIEVGAIGAYVGSGRGNKAILEIPGLAGTKVSDIKSLALEMQLVTHTKAAYGNAPYINFLIDLQCDQGPLPAAMTIAEAQQKRRHLVYNPNYQASGAVSSATFVTMEGTNSTQAWAISGLTPTFANFGMAVNANGSPLGTFSFDFTAYPNACIVDGVSADNGVWRDKTADPGCTADASLASISGSLAKCGRAYKGVIVNLGDSGNTDAMEWKFKKVRINDKTYRFKQ